MFLDVEVDVIDFFSLESLLFNYILTNFKVASQLLILQYEDF
jgi:hypothetical protein